MNDRKNIGLKERMDNKMNKPIALTPPMGWNSWNTFGENINEKMIFETADVMAESGLRDKGYEYLVIDDCWSLRERDENGRLVPLYLIHI